MTTATECQHLSRRDGVCVACGHCNHDVLLNGACLACGATEFIREEARDETLIASERLVRKLGARDDK
jgi:hypothetical protein